MADSNIEREFKALEAKINTTKKELDRKNDDARGVERDLKRAEEKLRDATREHEDAKRAHEALQNDITRLTGELQSGQAELARLDDEVKRVQAEHGMDKKK